MVLMFLLNPLKLNFLHDHSIVCKCACVLKYIISFA